jgi:hypothetical protein
MLKQGNQIKPQSLLKNWFRHKNVLALCKYFFNEELTPGQEEIVRTIAFAEHKRVVISCMTRYGKSWAVSMGILIWIAQNTNKKLGIIAPTIEKTTIIRNYIAFFVTRSPFFLGLLDLDKRGVDRIRKEVSKRRMTWKNGIEMRTLSAEGQGEQLMGFGFDILIVDESCDIDYEVYLAKITRMLGENPEAVYVEIGNPWHRDNHMWQHWINPTWLRIHIGYEEAVEEGRISQEFVEEQRSQLPERIFKILYEAEFPEESEDQLIKYAWIQAATKRIFIFNDAEPLIKRIGADIARGGNDSTVLTSGIKQLGHYMAQYIEEHHQEDTMQTTGRIIGLNDRLNADEAIIDTTGVGGGVTDRLNELKKEGKFKPKVLVYMGGQQPSTDKAKERFLNQKAEAYFHLRDLFEHGNISIPKHPKLIDQLSKMKWELTSANKIRIRDPGEKEGDTAEQKSPDFADSLCYFCWEGSKPAFASMMVSFGKDKK